MLRLYRAYDREGRLLCVGIPNDLAWRRRWWNPKVAIVIATPEMPARVATLLRDHVRREEKPLWPNWGAPTRLYRAYDREGRLLYVGISTELTKRLARHAREDQWWKDEVTRVTKGHDLLLGEARRREMEAIREEKPVRNWVGNRFPALANGGRMVWPWAGELNVRRWFRAVWWRQVGYVTSLPVWIDERALWKPGAPAGEDEEG